MDVFCSCFGVDCYHCQARVTLKIFIIPVWKNISIQTMPPGDQHTETVHIREHNKASRDFKQHYPVIFNQVVFNYKSA